jgi:hypothetical protein
MSPRMRNIILRWFFAFDGWHPEAEEEDAFVLA